MENATNVNNSTATIEQNVSEQQTENSPQEELQAQQKQSETEVVKEEPSVATELEPETAPKVEIKEEILTEFKNSGYVDINDFFQVKLTELKEKQAPSSAEEYELDLPEEFKNIAEFDVILKGVKQTFFNSGLSKESAKKLYAEMQKSFAEQSSVVSRVKEQQQRDRQVEINRLLVDKFGENLSDGVKMLDHIKEKYAEQSTTLSPKELVDLAYKLQEKEDKSNNREASFLKPNDNSHNSEAFAEFQRIRTSKPFLDPNHAEHYAYYDRYLKLLEKI